MCGIAGIVSLDGRTVDPSDVRIMCSVLTHRGPDDEGLFVGSGAALGMRRLSIIDLETGSQPLVNEDRTIWAVCNGEIYNHEELRFDLERRGHVFATRSDAETIVHLYEELGPGCVDRLRGMFALAVWDDRRRELLLARDRLGIKPLYYAVAGGRLLFASELKAILARPEVERRLSWQAIGHLFTFQTTPARQSIVEGVLKLEPAHLLLASAGGSVRTRRYWQVRFEPDGASSEPELTERLHGLLEESVRLHLASDVPLGAFLSGGVDSSAVVATMARVSPGRVRTFSVGFDDRDYDELAHARAVARSFGTEHHEVIVTPDALDVVDDLAWHLDEPFGDSSAIPTFMVSRLASRSVKVVLSGDGGDELFAGYDKYVVEGREKRVEHLFGPVRGILGLTAALWPRAARGRNLLRHFSLHGPARYLDASILFRLEDQERLFRPEAFALVSAHDPGRGAAAHLRGTSGHWLSALQSLDLAGYLPLDILTKVDRMSMAHGLETRVPLLDHRLVEFAATLPPGLVLRDGVTKSIFKRALHGLLPDAILERRKQGFAVPLGRWFRGRLEPFVRDLLLSERCRRRGLFNERFIDALLARHARGRDLDAAIWTLISFELWCRTFLDATPAPRPSRTPVVRASLFPRRVEA
jgi:asparagine synthase (glutamine-hydrolysing)